VVFLLEVKKQAYFLMSFRGAPRSEIVGSNVNHDFHTKRADGGFLPLTSFLEKRDVGGGGANWAVFLLAQPYFATSESLK
jgi:hypothetical protein